MASAIWIGVAIKRSNPKIQKAISVRDTRKKAIDDAARSKFVGHHDAELTVIRRPLEHGENKTALLVTPAQELVDADPIRFGSDLLSLAKGIFHDITRTPR